MKSLSVMEAYRCNQQSCSSGQADGSKLPQVNVSIASDSRLPSNHQYKVRRPLFNQKTSILQTSLEEHNTVEQRNVGPKTEVTAKVKSCSSLQAKLREGQPSSHSHHSPAVDGGRIFPTLNRPPRPVLQIQRMSSPVRPKYTTLLSSTHKRTQINPEEKKNYPYESEYWACAIPKDPPPTLSGRDPHKDYEALLDYAYPLRPEHRTENRTLQDSGIEMDLLSSKQSDLNVSFCEMEHEKDLSLGPSSPDLMGKPFSLADHLLTLDQPEWSERKNVTISAFSAALITLPLDRGIYNAEDEEFRPLPGQLDQLQELSQQVRDAAARFQPMHREPFLPPWPSVEQNTSDTVEAHRRTEDLHPFWTKDSVDSLRGLEHSLMEHISVFCGHLEQLIRWLYAAMQKIEQLAPPMEDIHSVKTSLAQYQSFQRDINRHLPLTSSVLQTGQHLMRCIHSTSPLLRDSLHLIESQSRLLERHSEHFFSSILTAMDSLTQPLTEGSAAQQSSEVGQFTTES